MKIWIITFFLFLHNQFGLSGLIEPSNKLDVDIGQGFIAYLKTPSSFVIKKCLVKFRNLDPYEIDMKVEPEKIINTDNYETITRYSTELCGIRVLNISVASAGKWSLEARNDNDEKLIDSIYINYLDGPQDHLVTKRITTIGKQTINCEKRSSTRSCRIYDSENNFWDTCEHYTVIHDKTKLKCHSLDLGRIPEVEEIINIEIKKLNNMGISSVSETEDKYIMTCQLPDTIYHCRAEFPGGLKQLLLTDGMLTHRYSTRDTKTSSRKCELEISKPLLEEEKGIWKINSVDSLGIPNGCLFYIGDKKSLIEEGVERISRKKLVENIKENETITIKCEVPFPISRCYIRGPHNEIYFPSKINFERSKGLGLCEFSINEEGKWICGLFGPDYNEEIQQEIQVNKVNISGDVVTEKISGRTGDTVELLCRSYLQDPIYNCAFSDPNGNVHMLSDNAEENRNLRFNYFGEGFAYGFCGIKIQNVENNEFGEWKCYFTTVDSDENIMFRISLEQDDNGGSNVSNATSLGIGIGLGVLALVSVVAGTYIFIRKRRQNQNQVNTNVPDDL